MHDGNTVSDTAIGDERYERRIKAMEQLVYSYEGTSDYVALNSVEKEALSMRLADDYFWKLGYSLYWASETKLVQEGVIKKRWGSSNIRM